jgi:hypothetical protein
MVLFHPIDRRCLTGRIIVSVQGRRAAATKLKGTIEYVRNVVASEDRKALGSHFESVLSVSEERIVIEFESETAVVGVLTYCAPLVK